MIVNYYDRASVYDSDHFDHAIVSSSERNTSRCHDCKRRVSRYLLACMYYICKSPVDSENGNILQWFIEQRRYQNQDSYVDLNSLGGFNFWTPSYRSSGTSVHWRYHHNAARVFIKWVGNIQVTEIPIDTRSEFCSLRPMVSRYHKICSHKSWPRVLDVHSCMYEKASILWAQR